MGTITEIYDYLRVLFARIGEQYCIHCGNRVGRGDAQGMVRQILALPPGDQNPDPRARRREPQRASTGELLENLERQGYARVRIDGVVQDLENVQSLAKHKKHTIEVVVDRLVVKEDEPLPTRLTDSVETAFNLGQGSLIVHVVGREDLKMSEARSCCGIAYPELDPPSSPSTPPRACARTATASAPNSPWTWTSSCRTRPSPSARGPSSPTGIISSKATTSSSSWGGRQLTAIEQQLGIDFDTPWEKLPKKQQDLVLYGSEGREVTVRWDSEKIQGDVTDGLGRRWSTP